MSVSCECCVLSGTGFASGRLFVQRSPTDCECVRVCDLETSAMRRPWPALGCCAKEEVDIKIRVG